MARAAQSQANKAQSTAGQVAGNYENEAQAQLGTLEPILNQRLKTEHALSPDQINEVLNYANAGSGGATGALEGRASLQQARTGQGTNLGDVLDTMQRQKSQQMAKTSEGVANEDVQGALKENQEAATQLGQLYGVTSGDALKAMGVQSEDIKDEIGAGESGWFQNLTSLISSLGKGAEGAGDAYSSFTG